MLFVGEQRWVLRDEAELEMMLQMYGLVESNEGTLLAAFEAWQRGQNRTCSEPGNA